MPNPEEEEERHLSTLDELEATREEITSYQGLFKELPQIFECKFNERLKPLLERNHQLIEERERLLQQIQQTLPSAKERSMLLLNPSFDPAQQQVRQASRFQVGRILWLLGLTAAGIAFGLHLSRPPGPAPQQPSKPFPLKSVHQPLHPDSSATAFFRAAWLRVEGNC